jgi:hypothetical protein
MPIHTGAPSGDDDLDEADLAHAAGARHVQEDQ